MKMYKICFESSPGARLMNLIKAFSSKLAQVNKFFIEFKCLKSGGEERPEPDCQCWSYNSCYHAAY